MIHDFIFPLIAGMGIGAIIAFLSVSLGRSPVLERRRWKAIWANERWLKDLQDFIDQAFKEIKEIHHAIELVVQVILGLHPEARRVLEEAVK